MIKFVGMIDTDIISTVMHQQRDMRNKKVDEIVRNYNEDLFGAISISYRDDGTHHVFDGQNRLRAATLLKLKQVPAIIHTGLTPQDEARLFWMYEKMRDKISSRDYFINQVASGEEFQTKINEIVEKHKFSIAKDNRRRSTFRRIGAVKTLEKIAQKSGFNTLDITLGTIASTWPRSSYSLQAQFIEGVAKFMYRAKDNNHYDPRHAYNKFIELDPHMVVSKSKSIGGSVIDNIFRELTEKYNFRLTKNKLSF